MKIRTSLVSNSSSSSFIILKKKKYENLLRKKLNKYSLDLSKLVYPLDKDKKIKMGKTSFVMKKKTLEEQIIDDPSFRKNIIQFDVICNEDDVIIDLFKNKIPFIATIHYEHFILFFDGKKLKVFPTNLAIFMYYGCWDDEETKVGTFAHLNEKILCEQKEARFREKGYRRLLKECKDGNNKEK